MTNKKIANEIAVGVILLITIVVGGIFWLQSRSAVTSNQKLVTSSEEVQELAEKKGVVCTQDAKLCADGSYVSRTGPKCEFAPCSNTDETANWQTYRNEEMGIEFKYPDSIGVSSVQTDDQTKNPPFSGKSISAAFIGEKGVVNFSLVGFTSDYKFYEKAPEVSCENPSIYDNRGNVCNIEKFVFGDVIMKNSMMEAECSVSFTVKALLSNLSNSEYETLQFLYVPKDIDMKISNLYDCVNDNTEGAYSEALTQSKNIISRSNLSQRDREGLDTFIQMVATFKFIK